MRKSLRYDLTAGAPPTVARSAALATVTVDGNGNSVETGAFDEDTTAALGESVLPDKRYFINVRNGTAGAGASDFYLYKLAVQFRVYQALPS